MTRRLPLSALLMLLQDTVEARFDNSAYWITAEITDVKKYESKRWCFLKFIEKHRDQIVAEIPGVFWAVGYQQIVQFERLTKQTFRNGIEVSCLVAVKFHLRYGVKLEVLEIDTSVALGQIELQRRQTIDRLLAENASTVQMEDDVWTTFNNQLALPLVIQRIALITAHNSDGQRDFNAELLGNQYGYHFTVTEFTCLLQGDEAANAIIGQLQHIFAQAPQFDVVAIVRGGGSQTDFSAFDDYELCRRIAGFPLPIFTGIGHDRNTSIADLMARQLKTPTKVAAAIVDHNYQFELQLLQWQQRIFEKAERTAQLAQQQVTAWRQRVAQLGLQKVTRAQHLVAAQRQQVDFAAKTGLQRAAAKLQQQHVVVNRQPIAVTGLARQRLENISRIVHQLSPQTIINKGFAVIEHQGKLVTNASNLMAGETITTILKDAQIASVITQKIKNDHPYF